MKILPVRFCHTSYASPGFDRALANEFDYTWDTCVVSTPTELLDALGELLPGVPPLSYVLVESNFIVVLSSGYSFNFSKPGVQYAVWLNDFEGIRVVGAEIGAINSEGFRVTLA